MITLLILLQFKHFICDFPLQKPYQYLNKGTYGHLGGILHSLIHGTATVLIILAYIWPVIYLKAVMSAIIIGLIEAIIHYHIDWTKVKINKFYGWKCDNSEKFWWLLGFDQLLHQMTYIAIIYYLFL